jgi:hypothetical protein
MAHNFAALRYAVKAGLKEIWMAETQAQASQAFDTFLRDFDAKYPKAVGVLKKDRESLLAFYNFPAEHWLQELHVAQYLVGVGVPIIFIRINATQSLFLEELGNIFLSTFRLAAVDKA